MRARAASAALVTNSITVLPRPFSIPGKVRATMRLRLLARLRAMALGRKFNSAIAASIRCRVAAEIGLVLLMA